MSGLFLKLLNMSILQCAGSWLWCWHASAAEIAEVDSLYLVALVGIRLLCPFQLETTFSLAPNAQVVSIEQVR